MRITFSSQFYVHYIIIEDQLIMFVYHLSIFQISDTKEIVLCAKERMAFKHKRFAFLK